MKKVQAWTVGMLLLTIYLKVLRDFFFFLILLLPSKQETENYKRMIEFGIGSSQGATLSPYAEDKIGLWAPDAPVTLLPRLFTQCICLC